MLHDHASAEILVNSHLPSSHSDLRALSLRSFIVLRCLYEKRFARAAEKTLAVATCRSHKCHHQKKNGSASNE